MNKAILGFLVVLFAVASAQGTCMENLESTIPAFQKMYLDYSNKNWAAFEGDIERFIPVAKTLLAACANYTLPDTPRTQACITDVESIAKLAMPVFLNPDDKEALYALLLQLPGYLSSLYSQCINPTQVKTDHDYVTVLLQQKSMEGDIYTCISSVYPLFPILKKLAVDIASQAEMEVIQTDLSQIGYQVGSVCDACGLPKPFSSTAPNDIEQCMARLSAVYTVIDGILNANYDISKIVQGIMTLVQILPLTLSDCGVQI